MQNDEPSATTGPGSRARLHEVSGPTSPDTPMARTAWNSVVTRRGVSASRNDMSTAPVARNAPDTSATGRTPTRSVSTPASGLSRSAATVPGRSTTPASSADPPHSPSTYSGTTSVTPMNEAFNRFCAMNPARYWREAKISMLTSGSDTRFCRRTNSARNKAPNASGAHTKGLVTEKLLASENASKSPPNPNVESDSDHTSSRASRSGASEGLMASTAAAASIAIVAASSTKKLRQPNEKLIAPPMVGPMFGANPMAMPAMPIAVAWRPQGKRVMAMVCISGMSMPVDAACSTRPIKSTPKFGAHRSAAAPARKNAMAMSTCWRTGNRHDRNVATGTVTPSTSM